MTKKDEINPDMPTQELLLHMGELSAEEIRVARAAIRWANTRPRPAIDVEAIKAELHREWEGVDYDKEQEAFFSENEMSQSEALHFNAGVDAAIDHLAPRLHKAEPQNTLHNDDSVKQACGDSKEALERLLKAMDTIDLEIFSWMDFEQLSQDLTLPKMDLIDLLLREDIVASRGEAKRLIAGGGLRLLAGKRKSYTVTLEDADG